MYVQLLLSFAGLIFLHTDRAGKEQVRNHLRSSLPRGADGRRVGTSWFATVISEPSPPRRTAARGRPFRAVPHVTTMDMQTYSLQLQYYILRQRFKLMVLDNVLRCDLDAQRLLMQCGNPEDGLNFRYCGQVTPCTSSLAPHRCGMDDMMNGLTVLDVSIKLALAQSSDKLTERCVRMVLYLVRNGATLSDMPAWDVHGRTALHMAAASPRLYRDPAVARERTGLAIELCVALMGCGYTLTQPASSGSTALDEATHAVRVHLDARPGGREHRALSSAVRDNPDWTGGTLRHRPAHIDTGEGV